MAEKAAELTIVMRARNLMKAALDQGGKQISGLVAQARKYQNELASIGRSLLIVATVSTGIFGAAAVQAANLEEKMFGVQKTSGLAASAIAGLKDDFLKLSKEIPTSATELAGIGEIAGQLGIQSRADILEFTKTIAQIGTVTDFATVEAAENLARLSNIFELPIREVGKLGGVINELENTTTAKAPVIADFMQRLAVASKQLGLSVADVAGLSATLVDLGFQSEMAGTAVSKTFTSMISDAAKFAAQMGISVETFRRRMQEDAIGTIVEWARAIQALPTEQAIAQFEEAGISGQRALMVFGALTEKTGLLAKNVGTANKEFLTGTSLLNEFAIQVQSTWNQTKIFRNRIMDLANTIGEGLIPLWRAALVVGKWFLELLDVLPKPLIQHVALITAVAGAFAGLVGAIMLAVKGFALLGVFLTAATAVLGPFSPLLTALFVIVSVGAIAIQHFGSSLRELEKKTDKSAEKVEKFNEETKKLADVQVDVQGALNKTAEQVDKVGDAYKLLGIRSTKDIGNEIITVKQAYQDLARSGQASGNDLARAADAVKEKVKGLKEELKRTGGGDQAKVFSELSQKMVEIDLKYLEFQQDLVGKAVRTEKGKFDKMKELRDKNLSAAKTSLRELTALRNAAAEIEEQVQRFHIDVREKDLSFEQRQINEFARLQKEVQKTTAFGAQFTMPDKERVQLLDELIQRTIGLGRAAQEGSALERNAQDLVSRAWRERKKIGDELEAAAKALNDKQRAAAEELTGKLKDQEGVIIQLKGKFEEFEKRISEIKAIVQIADEQKLLAAADNLRGQLIEKFGAPINQVIRVVEQRVGSSGGSKVSQINTDFQFESSGKRAKGFAHGINFVPVDGLPAILHRGETVLTRGQADRYRAGQGGDVHIGEISFRLEGGLNATKEEARRFARMIRSELSRVDERSAR